MARLPFNPDDIADPPAEAGSARRGAAPLTVSQAAQLIKTALAQHIPAKVRVVGEVSNFSNRQHWFFSIKDEQAALRCVCFATSARRVGFAVKDGMQVVVTGRIDFYDAQGNVQLYVDAIEPVGVGELELRFRALCDELRKLGYFDVERKKPLAIMPRRIAVVTSRTGAALQDVINTARQRWPGCQLLLLDVHVQGPGAAAEIAAALDALSKHGPRLGVEAVLLTRGGGSIEDLCAFNERAVADAVFRCPLPIVAAIGHETDTTIAELVADVRCATPTQAAMTLVPDRTAMAHQLEQLWRRLALLVNRHVSQARQHLTALARHPVYRRPRQLYDPLRQRLDALVQRLTTRVAHLAKIERDRLDALQRQFVAVGPQNVLKRGYSYTLGPGGQVLRSVDDAAAGDRITTVLADGRIASRVEGDTSAPTNAPNAGPAPDPGHKPKRSSRRRNDDSPGLFNDV